MHAEHERLLKHLCNFQSAHGTDASVRIGNRLVWETKSGEFSFRQFGIVCAINSMIGRKVGPVRITRSMILARMLGYKSPKVMEAEFANRTDGMAKLTERQLRDALDDLQARKFFLRVNPNRRSMYFTTTLDEDQLVNAVVHKKTVTEVSQAKQRDMNERVRAAIAKARAIKAVA